MLVKRSRCLGGVCKKVWGYIQQSKYSASC